MNDRPAPPRLPAVLIVLVAVCSVVEAVLLLGDTGLMGGPRLRAHVYEYGAFWPGLLDDWQPNYAGQPYAMFVTYAFLHGGLLHLVLNMITLVSIGRAVCDRVTSLGFAQLYLASLLGGAVGYAALARTPQPMVGASGALFGLVGALLAWGATERIRSGRSLWPILRAVLFLIALNLAFWWVMDGLLAWQTHLGGFLAGAAAAVFLPPANGGYRKS